MGAKESAARHWPLLDAVRFFAALLVLCGHARGLLLVGIERVENPSIFVKGVYFLSGLQHEAVVVFFVVSGFLIGGKVWDLIRIGCFDFRAYLIGRFTRIYIVYLPSLVLVAVLNMIGYLFLSETRLYGERPLFPSGVSSGWTFDQIPCHLLSVQGVMCAPWGANPPVWSLGFEWVLYLIAPAVFYAALTLPSWISLGLISAVMLPVVSNPEIIFWSVIWLTGTVGCVVSERLNLNKSIGWTGAVLFIGALVVSRLKIATITATDLAAAAGIGAAFACQTLVRCPVNSRLLQRGARFSYSLYLIHLPVCLLFGALLERFARWPHTLVQPDAIGLGVFALTIGVGLLIALLFAMATEDRTAAMRRLLTRLWLRRTADNYRVAGD